MAKKKTTLGKVGEAIAGAATTAIHAADKHVVEPVGDALGLTGGKPGAKKPAKKPVAKSATKSVAAKPSAKKPATGTSTQTTAKKMLGSVASNAIPKATGAKPAPKTASKKKG